jgi:hypothetical protein
MPWGAAIGAVGAIIGGSESSSGAQSAANAQAAAAQQAAQIQQQEFNTVEGLNAPGRNLGYGADSMLASLFGIANPNAASTSALYPANSALTANSGGQFTPGGFSTGGGMIPSGGGPAVGGKTLPFTTPHPVAAPAAGPAAGTPNFANFFNTPGYQFTLNQGEQAINRGAAAGGNAYSTSTLAGLNNYAQGAASTQYNNYVQQLMGLAGIGGTAVAGTGSAALQTGANISNATMQAGAANASGILNSTAATNQAIQGGLSAVSPLLQQAGSTYFGGVNGGGTSNPYNSGAAWSAAGF